MSENFEHVSRSGGDPELLRLLTFADWADEVIRQQNEELKEGERRSPLALWPDETGSLVVLEKGSEGGKTYYTLSTNVGEEFKPSSHYRHWPATGATEVCSPAWKRASIDAQSPRLHELLFTVLRAAPYTPDPKNSQAHIDQVFAELTGTAMVGAQPNTLPVELAASKRSRLLAKFVEWFRHIV
jgi:hypothetical protein